MAAIDTLELVIGDVAAAVAAGAALIGLVFARQTVREARADRISAEQARLTRRVEWVGETIEHIDRLAEDDLHMLPNGETWRRGCRLLAQGFIGLDGLLPQTAQLAYCADPYSARSIVARAREEVGAELARLAREQAQLLGIDSAAADDPAAGRARPRRLPTADWTARWRRDGRDEDQPEQTSNGSERQAGHEASHRLRRDDSG